MKFIKNNKLETALIGCYFVLVSYLWIAGYVERNRPVGQFLEEVYSDLFGLLPIIIVVQVILSAIGIVKGVRQKKILSLLLSCPTFVFFLILFVNMMLGV